MSARTRAPLLILLTAIAAAQASGGLREQLGALAEMYGFVVNNLHLVGAEPAKQTGGDPVERVQVLLEDYNYVAFYGPLGELERIDITRRKAPPRAPEITFKVKTERLGAHHFVQALLEGANPAPLPVSLMVDTGASTLVLPSSMIEALGFEARDLDERRMHTAGGAIVARLARLSSVRVGEAVVTDVLVTFVPEEQLGAQRLLGMSFLDSFRVTIDDANSELVLTSRAEAP